jgi:DNA topoisomerase-1
MSEAELEQVSVDLSAEKYGLRANGMTVAFAGFYKVYPTDTKETILPNLEAKEKTSVAQINGVQHMTEPPARYSDASLVKALEEYGIGRPSTYAPTIATIIERNYVERIENRRLKPTEIAIIVNDLLVEHFPEIVDYNFTAKMEEELDEIAEGEKKMVPVLEGFWKPFSANLDKKQAEITGRITDKPTDIVCDKCGKPMVIKTGRYGEFLSCSGYPECKNARPVPLGVPCPKCGGDLAERRSKRGKTFYGCTKYPACDFVSWNRPVARACEVCANPYLVQKYSQAKGRYLACPACKAEALE